MASGNWPGIYLEISLRMRNQGPFLRKGNALKKGVCVSPLSFRLVTSPPRVGSERESSKTSILERPKRVLYSRDDIRLVSNRNSWQNGKRKADQQQMTQISSPRLITCTTT